MLKICDRAEFLESKRTMTPEGFMLVPATLARCGVYDYSEAACKTMEGASAIRQSLGLKSSEPLRVYRSPAEVFDDASMASFARKPVTNNHPPEWISAKNAKYYTVGNAGENIERDGIYQKTVLMVTDENSIKDIKAGKVEISNGYECDIVKEVAVTDDGEAYHAKFVNIRGNHIAIVSKGRAGSGCRISDSEEQKGENMKTKTIVYDGVSYEFDEQAVAIIGKLEGQIAIVQDSLTAAKTEHGGTVATMQAEIDTQKQLVADAQAQILDGAELDAKIEARTALITDAKALVKDFDASGKTDEQIIEAVVLTVCDSKCLDGVDPEHKAIYCKARFDAALASKDMKKDNASAIVIDKDEDEDKDKGEEARNKFAEVTEKSYMGEK